MPPPRKLAAGTSLPSTPSDPSSSRMSADRHRVTERHMRGLGEAHGELLRGLDLRVREDEARGRVAT
jgi:hypothetical protein